MKKVIARFALILAFLTCPLFPGKAQVTGLPPIPETAQYNIDLADIYARIFPDSAEIEVVASMWLTCDGINPVVLKLDGNIKYMKIEGRSQTNLNFVLFKPYIHFYNINAGSHQIVFKYRARHDGITSSGTVNLSNTTLPAESFWYPRNVADDPHQVILNVETPPSYPMSTNGTLVKESPNNLWWIRQFILSTAAATGLTVN